MRTATILLHPPASSRRPAAPPEQARHNPRRAASPPPGAPSPQPDHGRANRRRPTVAPGEVQASSTTLRACRPFWAAAPAARLPTAPATCAARPRRSSTTSTTSPACSAASRQKPHQRGVRDGAVATSTPSTWLADNAIRSRDERVNSRSSSSSKKRVFSYEPLGVVGVIAPGTTPGRSRSARWRSR